jgi:hypothetical protein
MKAEHLIAIALLLAVTMGSAVSLAAEGVSTKVGGVEVTTIAGWNELVDSLRDLPARMLLKLPEPLRSDPQIQQEVGRVILAALASSTISTISGDGDHPVFLPTIGQTFNIGQPNADTVYKIAQISAGGTYRLRGRQGSLKIVTVSQTTKGKKEGTAPRVVDHDLNALQADPEGHFEVLLSADRPAGYTGDWWQLKPETTSLLMRMVSSDWNTEQDPSISIERLDSSAQRPRISAEDLEERLRQLPYAIAFIAPLFINHVDELRKQGYVNTLKVADFSQIGGLNGQFYYEGVYELADDEALIVEATVPESCMYRSLILTNELYETTDWYNNHSSLNDAQSSPDDDGVLRVVVSAQDPGVPNWLDTAGYPRGVVQGRWTDCSAQPVPTARKVAVADVRNFLPASTPTISQEQRQQLIRARREALQQRPLW